MAYTFRILSVLGVVLSDRGFKNKDKSYEAKARELYELHKKARIWAQTNTGAISASISAEAQGNCIDRRGGSIGIEVYAKLVYLGSEADIKRAMVDIDGWLAGQGGRALMLMQVHDELVFEADEAFLPTLLAEVPARMAGAARLRVPLVVDGGTNGPRTGPKCLTDGGMAKTPATGDLGAF